MKQVIRVLVVEAGFWVRGFVMPFSLPLNRLDVFCNKHFSKKLGEMENRIATETFAYFISSCRLKHGIFTALQHY